MTYHTSLARERERDRERDRERQTETETKTDRERQKKGVFSRRGGNLRIWNVTQKKDFDGFFIIFWE